MGYHSQWYDATVHTVAIIIIITFKIMINDFKIKQLHDVPKVYCALNV